MSTADRGDSRVPIWMAGNWLRILEWSIGSLMVASSWLHLKNHMMFYLHVAEYKILPVSVLPWFALTIPWLMLFAGMLVIARAGHPAGPLLGAAIFILFGIAQAWAMLHGYDIDCGCFGSLARKKIGVVSIFLPILLATGCVVIMLSQPRVLRRTA